MHAYSQSKRFSFKELGKTPYFLENAPIGWNEIEQEIARSKKTDGAFLNIIQNMQFVGADKRYLSVFEATKGRAGELYYIVEKKTSDGYAEELSGVLDFESWEEDEITCTLDWKANNFREVLSKNAKENFELDRTTDINGNPISELARNTLQRKKREIFLRSELRESFLEQNISISAVPGSFGYFTAKMTADPISDDNTQSVLDSFVQRIPAPPVEDLSAANFFHFNADRPKTLTLDINYDVEFFHENAISTKLVIKRYNLSGVSIVESDFVEDIELVAFSSSDTVVYSGTTVLDVAVGDCLMLATELVFNEDDIETNVNKSEIIQTEDSSFDPINATETFIDVISLKNAFARVLEIIDPSVEFKSDFLDNKWSGLVLHSGETARHVKYVDEDTAEETIAPLATVSFERLFNYIYSKEPCAYEIRIKGNKTIVELEDISYFRGRSVKINLGKLSDVKTNHNPDLAYGKVAIGSSKSGENEEVFGLQATHTLNEFLLPLTTSDKEYKATHDFRDDPTEFELCYRKQYSQFPDEDTRYDKDVFIHDAYLFSGDLYLIYEWQEHFSAVGGIYSPDTAWNYRLSPINCLLRHGFNFKQEYVRPIYSGKSVLYQNTKGNVQLRTTLIGGVEYSEDSDVPLSVLGNPINTAYEIEGSAVLTEMVLEQLNGGIDKQNYLDAVSWIDNEGNVNTASIESLKIKDEIKVNLTPIYGSN